MMRRLFFLWVVSLLFLCGFSDPNGMKKVKMTGNVIYVGNEPFSQPVFQPVKSKESYILEDEKIIKILSSQQGILIEVTGEIYESAKFPTSKCLKVKKWKRIGVNE